jgi:hypothetical protein
VVGRPHERRLGAVERAGAPRRPRDAEHDRADPRAELVPEGVVGAVDAVGRREVGEQDHERRGGPGAGRARPADPDGDAAGVAAQPQIRDTPHTGTGFDRLHGPIVQRGAAPRQSDDA